MRRTLGRGEHDAIHLSRGRIRAAMSTAAWRGEKASRARKAGLEQGSELEQATRCRRRVNATCYEGDFYMSDIGGWHRCEIR